MHSSPSHPPLTPFPWLCAWFKQITVCRFDSGLCSPCSNEQKETSSSHPTEIRMLFHQSDAQAGKIAHDNDAFPIRTMNERLIRGENTMPFWWTVNSYYDFSLRFREEWKSHKSFRSYYLLHGATNISNISRANYYTITRSLLLFLAYFTRRVAGPTAWIIKIYVSKFSKPTLKRKLLF